MKRPFWRRFANSPPFTRKIGPRNGRNSFRGEDLRKYDIWDMVISLINNVSRFEPRFQSDIAEKAILYCFLSLAWDLKRLVNDQEPNIDVSHAAFRSIFGRRGVDFDWTTRFRRFALGNDQPN